MQIRKAEHHMQTSLRGIAKRAKTDFRHRFGNLYSLLNEENLRRCFPEMNRKAAPGVDAVDYESYKADLTGNVNQIVAELKGHRYKAKLIRRKYIPKAGGRRPLGIPVVGDKLLQTAAAQILSAIMDHEWLMKMLEQRIEDRMFLGLIRKWLKAGILEEDGQVIYPVTGTPQGGVISAVLANIYLHYALDIWFEKVVKAYCKGDVMMMRYADDFVCCFQYQEDVRRFYKVLGKRLNKFKLELSEEKTRVLKFTRYETRNSKTFTFLGFEYWWGKSRDGRPLVMMQTSRKKFRAALRSITDWIKDARSRLLTSEVFEKLRQKLQGHWNYYGVRGNYRMLSNYYHQVLGIMYKWLNRRSQRRSCNWTGFEEMLKYYRIPRPRIIGYWN